MARAVPPFNGPSSLTRSALAQRTLQRWFRRAGLLAARSGRRAGPSSYQRAQQPHDVWQMDAADQVALQNGRQVCWLRIADECSGAVLQTTVFPPSLLARGARS
jgi:transposase InsO family protein